MIGMIKFNISASSYSLFKQSPLIFYYRYIAKAKSDTKTNGVYGDAGNVVHNTLDDYYKDKDLDTDKQFEEMWLEKNLNTLKGFNGKILDKNKFKNALNYGKKLIDSVHNIINSEEYIELPFAKNINIKGYIDAVADKDGDIHIIDWKTNSAIKDFTVHAKMYFLLFYLKHKIMPTKAIYEYIKLGKARTYKFTMEEILEFQNELQNFIDDIKEWGYDINKYEVGDIDNPFNDHKQKCLKEQYRRSNENSLIATLKNNRLHFNEFPEKLMDVIRIKYSYFVDGYNFSPLYKKRLWDGKKYLLKHNSIPYGLINNLKDLIKDYNDYYGTTYWLDIIDERDMDVVNKEYDTVFKESKLKLRDYQVDSIFEFVKNKIGIIAIGCGGGKTFIAADIIKNLNRKTLLIVNNIELAKQTKDVLEEELGVDVGFMTDGNLDVYNQITVASVQTIHAILRRGNKDTKLLKKFLYNVTFVVSDEVQNVSDSTYYKSIYNNTSNLVYCLGLSGSPYRNGSDTIEMNAFVGFPIYWKLTDSLTKDGYLVPTKVFFIDGDYNSSIDNGINYNDAYSSYIVENKDRNKVVVDLVNKFKDKLKILILVRRVKHGEIMNELIDNSFLINGDTGKKKRKESFDKFKNEKGTVLIGSARIFSAGINIPDLDMIINLTAHKSSIDSVQIIGRVKRLNDGKKCGYYVDFLDSGVEFFSGASKERTNILERYGEEILTGDIETFIKDVVLK